MIKRCGEGGIRTRDTLSGIHTFQACSFNHSDTSPKKHAKKWIISGLTKLPRKRMCELVFKNGIER